MHNQGVSTETFFLGRDSLLNLPENNENQLTRIIIGKT